MLMTAILLLSGMATGPGAQVGARSVADSPSVIMDPILVADPDNPAVSLLIYSLDPEPREHTIVAYHYDDDGSLRGFEAWSELCVVQKGGRHVRRLAFDVSPAGRVQLVLQEAKFDDGRMWRCNIAEEPLCPPSGSAEALGGDSQNGPPSAEEQNCHIPCSPSAYCSDWAAWCRGNCSSVREFSCTIKCGECSFRCICA
jgi:hypothetical protein